MVKRSFVRYAALYALLELTVFALLIWGFGLGWALVIVAATFMVGLLLAASGLKGQVGAMRRARRDPHAVVADGALVGVGTFLVFLPGVVSTAVGALMLAPPTRSAMRPMAAALVSRGVMRSVRAVNIGQFTGGDQFAGGRPLRRDYIDGEVLGEVAVDRLPVRR